MVPRVTYVDPAAVSALRSLYAEIPNVHCKGLCASACRTRIGMSDAERGRIERFTGDPLPAVMSQVEGRPCPLLHGNRCTVYGLRPTVCRLWGAAESMACPHGCQPDDGHYLTDDETIEMQLRAFEIGGSHFDLDRGRALLEQLPDAKPLMARVMRGDVAARGELAALVKTRFPNGVPLDE